MISSKAEYKHSDYHFPRLRADQAFRQLERSTIKRSILSDIANALGLIAFGIAVLVVLPFFFE